VSIKKQFYLLITGIVIIPVLLFSGVTIYIQFFTTFEEAREEFEGMRELAGLPEPPILMRILPFLIISGVALFFIVMSLLIARSIIRSITMLEDATRRIANGELDLTVDVGGSNEITSLANSFNKMRNAIKEEERRRYLFITGITHDLKTPLSLIKANVEAIEDGIVVKPEEQKRLLDIINKKVDELEGMINNLLNFVQMDSGGDKMNMCLTNLYAFLSSYIERVAIDGELLHHKVESEINLPDSINVMMDSLFMQRALDNIVNNCFRYTPKGACLFIKAALTDSAVKLTVSDNGNGINQKDLPYIFDIFYRGSASRSEQGMGMGLAVTKSIVDSHGWSITVSSEKDRGTSFTIAIPAPRDK